ncbi:GATOR complex protein MIOS [Colletotrichum spaethianum]|uniref:GATOR complex protein MIOS n=1 Tax=Colletotrichum spaethianum TaxID=700344 RepID=A0AA37NZ25_9PEZI|nr:GATOR complex protein MIOS [Colletotrichum spaethianum]GKT44000.1 GATOR complex protein MIOS [Colletotrichum spaethianum]
MDRPEPGLIKWSQIPGCDSFIHINLQHRVVQLYEASGLAQRSRFDYKRLSKHDDFPTLTTYDWSPTVPGLLAVGTQTGVVNLLRMDDNSNAYIELNLKMTRTCQAVAFSTEGLLAVGLDRVRMDQCLHIWDVNRLSTMNKTAKGFPKDLQAFADPAYRLEPSVSVSSVKFFEDNPKTLVVGIKAQGLRIHDLREPGSVVSTFQTKCNNNLAIDYADQNYFASSALDQPGIMIWDRRATSRPVASPSYLSALEEDDLPWGGALRLDRVVEMDDDPSLSESKHSIVRSLRYCRDRRGLLAVLSRSGQLKVLETNKEITHSGASLEGSPELLEVHKSHDMDVQYGDIGRKNDRIVSFDWVTLDSPVLQPRLVILRANGTFEILEQPSYTSDYLYKLTPWQPPHRGSKKELPIAA